MMAVYCHEFRGRCIVASVGELMSAATTCAGLDDFGDDSFREGLEILVRARIQRRQQPQLGDHPTP